jgi:hypothetical protein
MSSLKILSFEKSGRANKIWLDDGSGDSRMHVLIGGQLESYMGAYGLPAGAALNLILADGSIDGIDMPELQDPDCAKKAAAAIKKANKAIDWSAVDRDQVLADITLADDLAEQMVNSWAEATAAALAVEPMSYEDSLREMLQRSDAVAASHQQRQEELLASEYISSMPPELLRAPRGGESAEIPATEVGWAIQFVD